MPRDSGLTGCEAWSIGANRSLTATNATGSTTKEFSADDLAKGINLAAEFAEQNPFSEPFRRVEQAVREQQNYETPLHKVVLHNLSSYYKIAPEETDALNRIAAKAQARDKELFDQAAAAVRPVKHVIRVEAVR